MSIDEPVQVKVQWEKENKDSWSTL
jgi:hypothetical protein